MFFLSVFGLYFSETRQKSYPYIGKHLVFRFKTIVKDSVRYFYNFNNKFLKKIPALDTTMYRTILSTRFCATERKSSSFKSCWHKCSPLCSTIPKTTSFSLTNKGLGNYSGVPLMWSLLIILSEVGTLPIWSHRQNDNIISDHIKLLPMFFHIFKCHGLVQRLSTWGSSQWVHKIVFKN